MASLFFDFLHFMTVTFIMKKSTDLDFFKSSYMKSKCTTMTEFLWVCISSWQTGSPL